MTTPERTAPLATSANPVQTLHRSLVFEAGFEGFTRRLERILGHFPADVSQGFITQPHVAAERVKAAEGAQGLMIFSVFDHGRALNTVGAPKSAKQYLIGNPLVAVSMTRHDIRAGLYAPLRVLVYEQLSGRTTVEYDQPSSQFGQFGSEEVTEVARALDEKLERVLFQAAELSHD